MFQGAKFDIGQRANFYRHVGHYTVEILAKKTRKNVMRIRLKIIEIHKEDCQSKFPAHLGAEFEVFERVDARELAGWTLE